MQNKGILQFFEPNSLIQRSDIIAALRKAYPKVAPATLDWYIHTLLEAGQLIRRGRGRYEITDGSLARQPFVPGLPDELARLGKQLGEQFPFLTICFWSTAAVHSFTNHQPYVLYWLVETERDAVDAVLDAILCQPSESILQNTPVLLAADWSLAKRYHPTSAIALLVKPLISEAPLQQHSTGLNVPTAEKILVDLVADHKVFDLFIEELPTIYYEMESQFPLNMDRLRRYARRRHQLDRITGFLNPIHSINPTLRR